MFENTFRRFPLPAAFFRFDFRIPRVPKTSKTEETLFSRSYLVVNFTFYERCNRNCRDIKDIDTPYIKCSCTHTWVSVTDMSLSNHSWLVFMVIPRNNISYPGPGMERMQNALGYEEIPHMKYTIFCYFKINCFSGGDTICSSLSSKSQYMWYIAHPISGTPKHL